MEDTQHTALLISKFLKGELTPEEDWVLQEWIKSSPEATQYFQGVNQTLIPDLKLFDELWGQDGDERKERIIQKVKAAITPVPVISGRFNWTYIRYAAAVILLVTFCVFFFFTRKHDQVKQPVTFAHDVPAARERATVTLPDGRIIDLDAADDGKIVAGEATIKKNGGSIAYSDRGLAAKEPQMHLMQTPKGAQYSVVLADGSQAYLNAGSSISFPSFFKGSVRKVTVSGEVYFEVTKAFDKSGNRIPFIIDVNGKQTIEVKGTAFNIDAYGKEIRTTVAEGRVLVTGAKDQQLTLNRGQQAVNTANSLLMNNSPDLESIFAWKNGNFYFDAAPITEIMEQVKNWYNVDVEYRSKPTGTFTVFSLSRKVPLSQLLTILAKTREVRFVIEGDPGKNEQVKVIVEVPKNNK